MYLQERLASLEGVVAVRGLGLMVAADLAEGLDATQIAVDALGKGLLLNATGLHTLRFLPPLICTKYEVDHARRSFEAVAVRKCAPLQAQ